MIYFLTFFKYSLCLYIDQACNRYVHANHLQPPTPVFQVKGVDVNFSFMIVYGSELDADKICIIISIYFLHSYPILFCSWSDIVLNVKVVFFLF